MVDESYHAPSSAHLLCLRAGAAYEVLSTDGVAAAGNVAAMNAYEKGA